MVAIIKANFSDKTITMINDLSPPSTLFDLWKYVDDTTVSEVVKKGQISFAQQAVDHISEWSGNNLFQLNREKTKELVISFSHASPQFPRYYGRSLDRGYREG